MSGSGSWAETALAQSAKVSVRTRVRTCVWLFYHTRERNRLGEASSGLGGRGAVERLLHLLGDFEDLLDEAGVEGVAAANRCVLADDRTIDQGEVAVLIVDLVP